MVHWYVALGAGFGGLIAGMALGYWITYQTGKLSAKVEAAISNVDFRFP